MLIITYHWPYPTLKGHFGLLWWILQLFFILSAYLLTRILLNEKKKNDPINSLKSFYRNRILRIFPVYYLYLFLTSALLYILYDGKNEVTKNNIEYLNDNFLFLFSYTYNFVEILAPLRETGFTPAPPFSHLWSLSLEEQFYLFLPFIVLFFSSQMLQKFIVFLIITGLMIRWQLFDFITEINSDRSWLGLVTIRNTLFQLDTFAYGMALAVFDFKRIQHSTMIFIGILCLWITLLFTSAYDIVSIGAAENIWHAIKSHTFITYNYNNVFYFTITNILCAAFLLSVIHKSFISRIFEFKWMISLGKVSYGMYIYQFLILYFVHALLHSFYIRLGGVFGVVISEIIIFIVYLSALYIFSKLSYKYFESWFLKWKN